MNGTAFLISGGDTPLKCFGSHLRPFHASAFVRVHQAFTDILCSGRDLVRYCARSASHSCQSVWLEQVPPRQWGSEGEMDKREERRLACWSAFLQLMWDVSLARFSPKTLLWRRPWPSVHGYRYFYCRCVSSVLHFIISALNLHNSLFIYLDCSDGNDCGRFFPHQAKISLDLTFSHFLWCLEKTSLLNTFAHVS